MASSRVPALTDISVPALDDRSYIVDTSDTTDDASGSSRDVDYARLFGQLLPKPAHGRLTLTTGVPVTTSDVTAATNVFYTPYPRAGHFIALYDGTRWKLYSFTERTLALGTLTSAKPYDVFMYDNSGTLTLELSAAWTNATTRADALTTQDGILVKSGATTRRYLGTIYTTSTTTTEDSKAKRFVWNLHNAVDRPLRRSDATASWTYASATFQQANATAANQVEVVVGQADSSLDLTIYGMGDTNANAAALVVAIGEDAITPHADAVYVRSANNAGLITLATASIARIAKPIPLGYHAYLWIEASTAAFSVTIYGTSGASPVGFTAGMVGTVQA